jgi:glycosyltransferase involved in cell wall biosynthesis
VSSPRILLIGEDAPNSLARSYKRAFESLGASVEHYCDRRGIEHALPGAGVRGLRRYVQRLAIPAFNRNLQRQFSGHRADLVLVIKGQHIQAETVAHLRRTLGCALVNYYPDDPFCARHTNRVGERSVFGEYDICFTFQRHRMPDYLAAGARRVEYLPFARDPALHHLAPGAGPPRFDVVFIGNLDRERVQWLEPLAGFRLGIYGAASRGAVPRGHPLAAASFLAPVYGPALPEAFASGAISVNILRWGNYGAHNMRSFESPACGAFTLTSRSRELAELFTEREEIVFFEDADDLARQVKYYLDHPAERARIARAGFERVKTETYEARARSILAAVAG